MHNPLRIHRKETKALPTPTRGSSRMEFKVDLSRRLVSGYAATWIEDNSGDTIHRGAFAETIQKNHIDAINTFGHSAVRFLWQHDTKQPIGIILELKEDEYGLHYIARVSETAFGDDVLTLLSDGAVDRTSIGYSTPDKKNFEGKRDINTIDLGEISPVTFPLNPTAFIEGVKHGVRGNDMELKASPAMPVVFSEIEWKSNNNSTDKEGATMPTTKSTTQVVEVKKGARLSRATAVSIAGPLAQIVQVLGDAGHTINWETGNIEDATHDSHELAVEEDDPEVDEIADESEARGPASHNPGVAVAPGMENGNYSPTIIDNPFGARIKSIHGVIATLKCAKCGQELKCSKCDAGLANYSKHSNDTYSIKLTDGGQVKMVTGVRTSFKCAACGEDMKCASPECKELGQGMGSMDGMSETSSSSKILEYKHSYSAQELRDLGKNGKAFHNEDGTYSYPVDNADDLENAIHAVGRGNASHDAIRRYIIKRAGELGKSNLIPDVWSHDGSTKNNSQTLEKKEKDIQAASLKEEINNIKSFLENL